MILLSCQCRHRFPGGFELDVAFDSPHMVTSLFGPSGSGKTSVLSTIAGFLRPQSGKVELADRMLLDTDAGRYVPPEFRRVGVVFQDHLLFPHLSVEANLRYGQRHRTNPRAVKTSRVVEVLELEQLLGRRPRNLSGGERQRVALGRALLSGPELLLMDEPLASLDERLKDRILVYLERIVTEWEIPTLFVTHSQGEVRRLAGWVVVLEKGRVVVAGTPEDALSQPAPLGWKNSLGPANLLRLDSLDFHKDHATGRVGDQSLYLLPQNIPASRPVFVQFSPVDVTLSCQDLPGLSARNHLRGRVCQMVSLKQAVFVAVDIGQIFWAEITPDAAAELGLTLGSEVTCLLKAHSLRVVN
ncbi:MAG: molybdenum ABC transporter ATP-binding protein [Thermoguttaceae bacterium]